MTVETTVRTVDFIGDGSTTVFVIPYPFRDPAHVRVYLIDVATSLVTGWTSGADYTLTGGDPNGELTATIAPPLDTTLRVTRVVPYTQPMNLEPNDGFDAVAMEDALDKLTMMAQQLSDDGGGGGGSGPTLGIANVGTGAPVSIGLVGATYGLRSFKASGSGLLVASDADSIVYTLAGALLSANNLNDVANRQTALDTLTGVGLATGEFVLTKDTATGRAVWKVVPTGGGGESNTSSNAGGTVGLALAKVGANLPFRGLTAGASITLTPSGTDVTIATTGEANTSSNAGGTIGLALPKVGANLPFRGLTAGPNVTLTPSGTDVTISAAIIGEANTISTVGVTGLSLIPTVFKVADDLKTKGLAVGTGLSIASSLTDLTIGLTLALGNIGTGEGVIAGLVGTTYNLKSLKASGSGLSVTSDANSITYALAGVLFAGNNLSDVASRQTSLNTLTAVSAATGEHVLTKDSATGNAVWKVVPTGGGGEANTASNAGGTVGLALTKSGANLPFRGLTAGPNVTLSPSLTDVTISTTAEVNTASSAGGTVALPLTKVGANLPFRGLTAGANITLTPSGSDVTIAASTAGEANDIKTVASAGASLIPIPSKAGLDLQTKGIAGNLGIVVAPTLSDLGIGVDQAASLTWTGIEKFRGNSIEPASLPSDVGLDPAFFPHISHKVSRTAPQGGSASVRTASFTHVVVPAYAPPNECKTWEWASLILFDSAANDSGVIGQGPENVAHYVKSFKRGSAAQWGLCVEAANLGSSKTTALFGAEISCQSDGTENYHTTGPLSLFHGANTASGDIPSVMDHGLLIHPILSKTLSRVTYGIRIESRCDVAALIHGAPPATMNSGASFLKSNGKYTGAVIDLTGVASSTPALSVAAGHAIRLGGASNVADVRYNSASTMFGGTTDQAIEFVSGGAPSFAVRTDGLVGFRTGTRTNVGAAGAATALPALPLAYLPIWFKHPTTGVTTVGQIPIYNF